MENWTPKPMRVVGNSLYINLGKLYSSSGKKKFPNLEESFQFAYAMAYGDKHRNHRTKGKYHRKPTEIFVNAFQGKISEFVLYDFLVKNSIQVKKPDIDIYDRGTWDIEDLLITTPIGNQELKITVKSTKHFGNLLLLEKDDWNENAIYLPSNESYDYFVLVRINLDLEKYLKNKRKLYTNFIEKEELIGYINNMLETDRNFDIAGFLSSEQISKVISNNQIIKQGQFLNGRAKMDATNYYVQCGNMEPIENLVTKIKDL